MLLTHFRSREVSAPILPMANDSMCAKFLQVCASERRCVFLPGGFISRRSNGERLSGFESFAFDAKLDSESLGWYTEASS